MTETPFFHAGLKFHMPSSETTATPLFWMQTNDDE
jgi:hypothetical protein